MTSTDVQSETLREQIRESISCPIEAVARTSSYRFRLVAVAFVTIIIVLLYGALVLFAANMILKSLGGAFFDPSTVTSARNRGMLYLITAIAPAFASLCLVVALVKPLFVRSATDGEDSEMELSEKYEPYLYDFVRRLCRSVGAPVPSSIVVDANVNASASYLHGPWSRKLRLTVGMPLVLGLNTRQLAGVLAHEFGHFTQRGGMMLTWLIRTVNMWLYRAAWERDRWDEWLKESSGTWDLRIGWMFYVARAVVWLARLGLQLLFLVGALFSSRLMQEMEFDADRYEARLAGSKSFASTCRQMQLLNLCQASSVEDLDRFRREGRLPDNLPALVVANAPLVPPDVFRKVEEEMLKMETGKFDTHPSDHDRIVNAANEQSPGTFQIEAPGSILFRDAIGLARLVTIRLYKNAFGKEFEPGQVHATDELITRLHRETAEQRSGTNFLLNQFCMYRTFTLPRKTLGSELETANWKTAASYRREKLLKAAPKYVEMRRESSKIMDELVEIAAVRKLIAANFDLAQSTRTFPVNNLREVREKLLELSKSETDVQQRLEPFRQMLGLRLMDALELTRSTKILSRIGEPAGTTKEIKLILQCWNTISDNRMLWDRFVLESRSAIALIPLIEETHHEFVANAIQETVDQMYSFLQEIRTLCSGTPYPFSHAKGNVSLAYYLIRKMPPRDDHGQVIEDSMELIKSTGIVMQRCASRLGSIAEKVEAAFGLKPLELPPELTEVDEDDELI